MNRQVKRRNRNFSEAIGLPAFCAKEVYMKVIGMTEAGFFTQSIFNRARTIFNTVDELVFFKGFKGTV